MGDPADVCPHLQASEPTAEDIYPEGQRARAIWRLEKLGAQFDNDMIEILRPFHDRHWPLSRMANLTGLEEETIRFLLNDIPRKGSSP